MKIVTVLGTRPEIIRLSRIIGLLDSLCEHTLVFTGQNFSPELSCVFFQELEIRQPDYSFDTKADSTWRQIGNILAMTDEMLRWQTERFLALETHREGHVVHVRPA